MAGLAVFFSTGLNEYASFETLAAERGNLAAWVQAHPVSAPLAMGALYALVVLFSLPIAAFLTPAIGFLLGTMLNNAVAEATADAITNGADPALLEVPIFSLIPGTGRLQLTVTQFDPWDQVSRVSGSGAKVFDLFTNWAMQIAMGGWGFRARVLPNAPLSQR